MGILPLPPDAPEGFFWEWVQAEDAWMLRRDEDEKEDDDE